MKETGQQYWNSIANSWERFGDLTVNVGQYIQEKISEYFLKNNNDLILNLGSGGDHYLNNYGGKTQVNLPNQ